MFIIHNPRLLCVATQNNRHRACRGGKLVEDGWATAEVHAQRCTCLIGSALLRRLPVCGLRRAAVGLSARIFVVFCLTRRSCFCSGWNCPVWCSGRWRPLIAWSLGEDLASLAQPLVKLVSTRAEAPQNARGPRRLRPWKVRELAKYCGVLFQC